MNIPEKFIRVCLILAIALSIFFSYTIWVSPANKGTLNEEDSKTQLITDSVNPRKESDVFLPQSLTESNNKEKYETNSENLISKVQTLLAKAHYGTLTKKTYSDVATFNEATSLTTGIELNYSAPYLVSEYLQVFSLTLELSQLPDQGESALFSRIQVDKDKKMIRFIDMAQHIYYESKISVEWAQINELLSVNKEKWVLVENGDLPSGQYLAKNSVKLKKYSYILSQQPYTVYRNAFFQEPDKVRNNDDSEDLVLYSGNETMNIISESQLVTFRGETPKIEGSNNLYSKSFPYISKLGNGLGNLRYFTFDGKAIEYRIFVEGFPVFGTDNRGSVNITIEEPTLDQSAVNLLTSVNTIQVPIPSEEEVEMPDTRQVITELITQGAEKDKINNVIIGYTWHDIAGTNRVVDLLPEWYVNYDNQWFSVKQLPSKLAEMEAK